VLGETINFGASGSPWWNNSALDLTNAQLGFSAHAHQINAPAMSGAFVIGAGASAGSPNDCVAIGSSASMSNPGSIAIGYGATATGTSVAIGSNAHTHTVISPIEPFPDGASVRFRLGGLQFTGEVVSSTQDSPYDAPIYVIQPDNPLPAPVGKKPIARPHFAVERISPLLRFAEAVFAPG
jgi:hypothetical protein